MPFKTIEYEMNKLNEIVGSEDEENYVIREINEYADRQKVNIVIIGVGNAGTNMAKNVALSGELDAKIFAVEADSQHLMRVQRAIAAAKNNKKEVTPLQPILIGKGITNGLGTGGDPWKSYRSIMEIDKTTIENAISNADLVIILTGLGGGTGTGGAPAIAKIARERGTSNFVSSAHAAKGEPLIISIATLPFSFEKQERRKKAMIGLAELFKYSHSVIVIENDTIRELYGKLATRQAFRMIDLLVAHIAAGITKMLNSPLEFNVDFADMYRLMYDAGVSYVGIGESNSSNKVIDAVQNAISHPLIRKSMILDDNKAKGAIVYFEVPPAKDNSDEFQLDKFTEATEVVSKLVRDEGSLKWAINFDVEELCPPNEKTCYARVLTIIAGVETKYIKEANDVVRSEGGFEKFFKNYTLNKKKDVKIITELFDGL